MQVTCILHVVLILIFITAHNEVGSRLYFYRRVWFCSQGECLHHPPSGDNPHSRHPPQQTASPTTNHTGRYGQRAGGTHPTGMQYCYIFFYLLKLTSVKAAQVTTCFYLLMQIDLISSIYLFIYSKLCQEKQVEAITCICLLMEIVCWLYVLFVLIFIIYLFTFSKQCQQKQVEPTTCFYLLMEIVCWLYVLFILIFIIYLFIYSKRCQQKQVEATTCFYLLM